MQFFLPGALAALLAHPMGLAVEPTPEPQESAPIIGRQYDLRGLSLAAPREHIQGRQMALLPIVRGMRAAERYVDPGIESHMVEGSPAHAIIDAFMNTMDADLEMVEVIDDGLVYLQGDAATLERFGSFSQEVGARLFSHPSLDIRRFNVSAAEVTAMPDGFELGGRMPRATLEAWLDGGIDHAERSVLLSGSGLHTISDLESHTVTLSIDTEIASHSGIFDPSIGEVAVGTELTVSGFRVGNRVELSYTARQTRRRDVAAGSGVSGEVRLSSDGVPVQTDQSERWFETFGASGGSVTGQAVLDATSFIILTVGTAGDELMCVAISVDPNSLRTPAAGPIHNAGELSTFAIPTSLLRPTEVDVNWKQEFGPTTLEEDVQNAHAQQEAGLSIDLHESDQSMTGLMVETLEIHQHFELPGTSMFVLPTTEVAKLSRMVASAAPAKEFHVSVTSKDALGQVNSRGTLSVLSGAQGILVSGDERFLAKESNVEVAQHSATREPEPCTHFEGLVMAFQLGLAPDGSVAYEVKGQLATDLAVTESSANEATDSGLVAVSAAHLMIRENGRAKPGPRPGTWSIVLGDESKQGAYVEMTIETR